MDAVRAAGPETVEAVSEMAHRLLAHEMMGATPPSFLIERCLATLGLLGCKSAIPVVGAALRKYDGEVLVQAVAAAGDLAYLFPNQCVWLMRDVAFVVTQESDHEDVVIAGIAAFVAYRKDPAVHMRDALTDMTPPVRNMVHWATTVLQDPLLPPAAHR